MAYVEEFVAFLGWEVDNKELKQFEKQVDDLGNMLKKTATIVAGAATALTALTAIVNQATAANVAMAKSVGVSSEFLEALGSSIRPLGFDIENATDLIEEMNNKIGESIGMGKPVSGVADSVKILGLEFKALKELAPEEQFIQILDAAKNLENQQAAVSAVDILMGGEANKILGFLRSQDESLLELIQRQMDLNMLTEAGRKGAERFNKTFGEMKTVISSAKSEFFGLVGEALAPLLEKYADWITANNEVIKAKIADWADQVGRALSWVMSVMAWFIAKVDKVVDALGGMNNVLKLTGVVLAGVFGAKMVSAVMTFVKLMRLAGTEALLMNLKAMLIPATIAAIIALFILIGEDLYHFFTGGESALGKLGEKISKFVYEDVRPTIANFLGMTPRELDEAFLDAIDSTIEFYEDVVNWTARAIGAVIEFFSDFVPNIKAALNAGDLIIIDFVKGLGDMGASVIDFFAGLMNSFISWVSSIPSKLIAYVKQSVAGISGIMEGLPIVGDLFKGDGPTTADGLSSGVAGLSAPPTITASPGVRGLTTNTNRTNTSNQRTQMTNQFNITQNPGESGEALAFKVSEEIQRASARAVSANDSGIEV